MKKENDSIDMSDNENLNLNLDKDDEDLEFETFNQKNEDKSSASEKSKKSKKSRKKSSDSSEEFINPILRLFKKRKRSYDSSNSFDSFKKESKKKYKELSTFQKSYIQCQKENFEKNYKILKEDIKLLEEYEKEIFKDTNLDLMFIMDLTGSMGIWIEKAQKNIKNIIEEITGNNPGSKIRISFIGYTDFLDKDEIRIYNSKEFTEDINDIYNFISKLNCEGGGDMPEDIVGALKEGLKMKWESSAKYVILVCDAPCHGKKYHDIYYDKFEDGDPSGTTLEEMMKKFCEKNITFYCLEIDSSTEKMFKIMKEVYNDDKKFHIVKLWDSINQFTFFVSFSASILLGDSKYSKFKFRDIISNYRKKIIKKIVKKYINQNDIIINDNNDSITNDLIGQIENLGLGTEDKKLFDFINRMENLNINHDKNNLINNEQININLEKVSLININEQEINYNLRALSYNKDLNVVNNWDNPLIEEKEFKTQLLISYTSLKNNKDNGQYELDIYDKKLDTQKKGIIPFSIEKKYYDNPSFYIKKLSYDEIVCEQIGDYFNILLDEKLPYLKQYIKFQKHILYEMDIKNKNKLTENFITNEIYNNYKYIISEESVPFSTDICNPVEKKTLQSFSHFSYQISGGQLLIKVNYDKKLNKINKYKVYYIKDNEYKNILEFFSSHICDNTCKTLNLLHPRKKNCSNDIDDKFYSNKYLTQIKLCKCCSVPIKNYKDNKSLVCKYCSKQEISTKFKSICSQCKNEFFYSNYVYNCNLTNYPLKCTKCNSGF